MDKAGRSRFFRQCPSSEDLLVLRFELLLSLGHQDSNLVMTASALGSLCVAAELWREF